MLRHRFALSDSSRVFLGELSLRTRAFKSGRASACVRVDTRERAWYLRLDSISKAGGVLAQGTLYATKGGMGEALHRKI